MNNEEISEPPLIAKLKFWIGTSEKNIWFSQLVPMPNALICDFAKKKGFPD